MYQKFKNYIAFVICFSLFLVAATAVAEETSTSTEAKSLENPHEALPQEDNKNETSGFDALLASKAHTHDGLFFRLSIGPGYSYFTADYPDHDFTLSGIAIVPELSAGMSIVENLELTLGLSGTVMVAPSFELEAYSNSKDLSNCQMTQINIGPGLVYYLPYNMFVGGNVNISYMVFDMNKTTLKEFAKDQHATGVTQSAEPTMSAYDVIGGHHLGFAAQVNFGKEWWLTDNSSMGIGISYLFAIYPELLEGNQEKTLGTDTVLIMGHTAGLIVTATYN